MFKITGKDFYLNGVKVTDEPMLNYIGQNTKGETVVLFPSKMERRKEKNYVVLADENEALREVYIDDELRDIVRCGFRYEAENRLQELLCEDDYYNGNEKDYGEFEIE